MSHTFYFFTFLVFFFLNIHCRRSFEFRLKNTLTHSQFIDQSLDEDSEDDDQIIETEEELRKFLL